MRASRLSRLGRLEGHARAESQVGGMVRVPDEIGFPPPPDWVPAGGWPRGAIILVPEELDPETWSQRYSSTSGERGDREKRSTLHRLARLDKTFKPPTGISPEQQEALCQLVEACVAAGGGQQPDESKADAMARGLGLSGGAELIQQLKDRVRCGRARYAD